MIVDAPEPVFALVDPLRIEQVVVNLIENAIKFSPDGGAIEIAVKQLTAATVMLRVQDHGLGIPLERRNHIFDRFYQAHADHYRSGMGLGLYISRQIVEQHGGSITAEFPAEGGSIFVVTLPVQPSEEISRPASW